MMLSADPGSTCILSINVEPTYPVWYKGWSCLLSLRSMSSAMKVMAGIFGHTWCLSRNKAWLSSSKASSICIRNDSELASTSLSASLVFFKRWSSSCIVIRAGILANCTNILNQKGASSRGPEVFFNTQSNWTSYCFSFPSAGAEAGIGTSFDIVGYCVSSVVFSYCLR